LQSVRQSSTHAKSLLEQHSNVTFVGKGAIEIDFGRTNHFPTIRNPQFFIFIGSNLQFKSAMY